MMNSHENPILTAARAAMGQGATARDIDDDMQGYPVSYPGADGFTAVWEAAMKHPRMDAWAEQANPVMHRLAGMEAAR